MNYLEGLNEKQLEAVSETEGYVRYAHHMVHPHYRPLTAGCVCAGRMEGDVEAARKRERDLKNRVSRKESFLRREWKTSRNGNPYLRLKGHIIVLYKLKNGNGWKYAICMISRSGPKGINRFVPSWMPGADWCRIWNGV